MVIAMRAILVTFLISSDILSERSSTFLTNKVHLVCLLERVFFLFCVTFWTVVPFLTTGCSDRDLRVENMFAEKEKGNRIGQMNITISALAVHCKRKSVPGSAYHIFSVAILMNALHWTMAN